MFSLKQLINVIQQDETSRLLDKPQDPVVGPTSVYDKLFNKLQNKVMEFDLSLGIPQDMPNVSKSEPMQEQASLADEPTVDDQDAVAVDASEPLLELADSVEDVEEDDWDDSDPN